MTLPGTAVPSPVGKKSCQFTTPPTSRWCPLKIHRNVILRTVHRTLLLMVNIPSVIPGPVATLASIQNLIPEVWTWTPNPTVDRVQTPRVVMTVTGTTLETCSAQGRPTSPHPDKPEQKKKKLTSRKSRTPKGPSKATPKAIDKIAQEVGEDLIRKFQEEEDKQEHRSRSKKSKKDSDRKKEQEEEYQRQKKKKKKEKEWKEREEWEAKEAKCRAEQQQLEADKRMAQAKLIHTVQLKKYSEELLELQAYRKKYMTNTKHATINLYSHARLP